MKQLRGFKRKKRDVQGHLPKWDCPPLRCRSIMWPLLLFALSGLLAGQEPSKPAPSGNDAENARSFVVVLDAAHGGSDPGARISGGPLEKNITLEFGKRLRQALEDRGVSVKMARDSDVAISFEQRVAIANLARPSMFLSLHAEPGTGLHIYTPLLPSGKASTGSGRSLLLWQMAQSAFLQQSSELAATIVQALAKHDVDAQRLNAFVEPLASIAAPAVAVELPCGSHGINVDEDRVVAALAETIVARKDGKGGSR